MSDFAVVLLPNFTHGRSGLTTVSADGSQLTGHAAGLRSRTLRVVAGRVLGANASSANASVVLSTPNIVLVLDDQVCVWVCVCTCVSLCVGTRTSVRERAACVWVYQCGVSVYVRARVRACVCVCLRVCACVRVGGCIL